MEVTYDDHRSVQMVDVIKGQEVVNPRRLFGRKQESAIPIAPKINAAGEDG